VVAAAGRPGTLTGVHTYPDGVVVADGPSDGQPHLSELAVTPVRTIHFRPPWVACAGCTPLVAAEDWAAIAARSISDAGELVTLTVQTEIIGWFLTGES
jgi:hypothetical protein